MNMSLQRVRKHVPVLSTYVLLIVVTFLVITPILWMAINSLKVDSEYTSRDFHILPEAPRWSNYRDAIEMIPFWVTTRNTLFLAGSYASLTVLTSAMAGFAFAKILGFGRKRLFGLVMLTLLIPNTIYIIPQFVLFARAPEILGLPDLQLINTYWPWILWGLGGNAFHIFLFRQYFVSFPNELQDAAEVDGCNIFRFFFQIVMPNAKAAIAVSFILNFSWVWGDWFLPTIYLTSDNATLALRMLSGYRDPQGFPINTINMAGAVIYTLPLAIMFFVAQKHIMQGFLTSGMKG